MKTKILALALLSLNSLSSYSLDASQEKALEQNRMKILTELGLPLPSSGIKLVPRSALGLSEEQLIRGAKAEEDIKSLGYSNESTNRPKELLNFRNYAKAQFKLYAGNDRAASTHLRKSINDLKLAFKFNGINLRSKDMSLIAASPQGSFDERNGGWSGVVQYLDVKNIGVCSYALMNVKASSTAAELAIEDVTYDINNKATIVAIEGNKPSGFIYKVEWYDNDNFHELECASMDYSLATKALVISFANKIDEMVSAE